MRSLSSFDQINVNGDTFSWSFVAGRLNGQEAHHKLSRVNNPLWRPATSPFHSIWMVVRVEHIEQHINKFIPIRNVILRFELYHKSPKLCAAESSRGKPQITFWMHNNVSAISEPMIKSRGFIGSSDREILFDFRLLLLDGSNFMYFDLTRWKTALRFPTILLRISLHGDYANLVHQTKLKSFSHITLILEKIMSLSREPGLIFAHRSQC